MIMKVVTAALAALGACGFVAIGGNASAQSILVLNGTGVSSVEAPLTAAGFNVISGTLDPDQIASNLAAYTDIVEIWVWNDGTYGNTYSPADPSRDFSSADFAALDAFNAAHPEWIMDGLAWRSHGIPDEDGLSMNEAINLAAAGGGIVLGADDASGDAIVQHVNQVAAHFGFVAWIGTYNLSSPAQQHAAGALFASPSLVDVSVITSTLSYCDVPNGLQPNGKLLSTALFADQSAEDPLYPPNPLLVSEVFNGTLYFDVDHLVTTTLPGGGFNRVAAYCFGDGSGMACPCGNYGNPGSGCENSFGTGGGLLGTTGEALVSADTFVLNGSGMPPSASALYFQGSVALNGTQGVLFGDGLRCVGGAVIRLGTKTNSGGASDFGGPLGDTPISVRGMIPANGGTFFYQAWYRNVASFCTPSGFNLTNAIAVTWAP
jgi:hypothetical protein